MAVSELTGRTFFEHQQRRRRDQQARLTARLPQQPGLQDPAPPPDDAQNPAPPDDAQNPAPPDDAQNPAPPDAPTALLGAATLQSPSVPETLPLRILVTSGRSTGQTFTLHQGDQIIGREEGSEIRLDDPVVSHTHALLRIDGDQVTVEDLRSTNGTKVNGTTIDRQTLLAPGDELELGGVQLLLEMD